MKQTVNNCDFHDAFRRMDRQDQFSYEARNLLFEAIEEAGDATGEETELDVIALCCEYSEDSAEAIAENYGIDLSECDPDDDDAVTDAVRDYLEQNTHLVGETPSGFLYQIF